MGVNFNKVFFMGKISKDPEFKVVSGKPEFKFTLQVHRLVDSSSGKNVEFNFIDVISSGKLAQDCYSRLKKFSPVFVEGKFENLEIIAQNIQFL